MLMLCPVAVSAFSSAYPVRDREGASLRFNRVRDRPQPVRPFRPAATRAMLIAIVILAGSPVPIRALPPCVRSAGRAPPLLKCLAFRRGENRDARRSTQGAPDDRSYRQTGASRHRGDRPRRPGRRGRGRGTLVLARMRSGLALSLVLHSLLLLGLAFWYFAPKVNQSAKFDSRLAGSERGVEDGLESLGGLNTTLTMPEVPTPSPDIPDPVLSSIKPLEIEPVQPKVTSLVGSDRASAEGGMKNNNPGAGAGDGFGLARFGQGGRWFAVSRSRLAIPSSLSSGTLMPTSTSTSSSRAARRSTGKNRRGGKAASSTSTIPKVSGPRISTGFVTTPTAARRSRGRDRRRIQMVCGLLERLWRYPQADELEGSDQA